MNEELRNGTAKLRQHDHKSGLDVAFLPCEGPSFACTFWLKPSPADLVLLSNVLHLSHVHFGCRHGDLTNYVSLRLQLIVWTLQSFICRVHYVF